MTECSDAVDFAGRANVTWTIKEVSAIISVLCRNISKLAEDSSVSSNDERQELTALINIQLSAVEFYTAYLRNTDDPSVVDVSVEDVGTSLD